MKLIPYNTRNYKSWK